MQTRYQREAAFHDEAFTHNRRTQLPFYSIRQSSRDAYMNAIRQHGSGGQVLEYGCGPYSYSSVVVGAGAVVTGVDISAVAVKQYVALTTWQQLGRVQGCIMNAEQLAFASGSFDLVCGIGILHHLDLERCYREISGALKPGGKAVFLEPLGHNPFINLYRRLTPDIRTPDEHPLLMRDLKLARQHFGKIETTFFHLQSLAAVPLRNTRGFDTALRILEKSDRLLFRCLPFLRRYAWAVVMTMSEPRAGSRRTDEKRIQAAHQ